MGKASIYHTSVDLNQKDIVKQLRAVNISVVPVNCVKKFCDIVVGYKGINYLFEIKADHKKKLTKGEQEFKDSWKGQYHVVTSFNEILNIINGI